MAGKHTITDGLVTRHRGWLFAPVAAYSSETFDVVVPDGETWAIERFVGSAAYSPDTSAALVWDRTGTPSLVYATHGDGVFDGSDWEITGNGTKVLSIVLTNETAAEQEIGGEWIARVL